MAGPAKHLVLNPLSEVEICEKLKEIPLFHALDNSEITQLAKLCEQREYGEGRKIFSEGEVAAEFGIMLEGELAVRHAVRGQNVTVGTLKSGNFFGEASLFHDMKRIADVWTTRWSTILILPQLPFQTYMTSSPVTALKILTELSAQLFCRLGLANQEVRAVHEKSLRWWGKM